jgi:hypothetical protein
MSNEHIQGIPNFLESVTSSSNNNKSQTLHNASHLEESIKKIKKPRGKRITTTRNYQLYEGKTMFFCGGRFLTSGSAWAFCVSLFLIVTPAVLFFVFT